MEYEVVLIDFYLKYAPEKIGDVHRVLRHFRGREADMLRAIERKYGVKFRADGSFVAGRRALDEMTGAATRGEKREHGKGDDFWRRNGSFCLDEDDLLERGSEAGSHGSAALDESVFRAALEDSLERTDLQRWGRAKAMVVGGGAAGKSSTVRSLLGLEPEAIWLSTAGVELSMTSTADWRKRELGESIFTLFLARAAAYTLRPGGEKKRAGQLGQRRAAGKSLGGSSGGSGVVGVGGGGAASSRRGSAGSGGSSVVTRHARKSLKILSTLRSYLNNGKVAKPAALLEPGEVPALDVELIEEEMQLDEAPVMLTIWDYGGQEVFYTLHHLFLTSYGVYLIVFDMNGVLDRRSRENSIEELDFWVSAIHLHAPGAPTLLVGTFMDRVRDSDLHREVDLTLQNQLDLDALNLVHNTELGLNFFPIDNMSRSRDRALHIRAAIEASVSNEDYVNLEVSPAWAKMIDELLARRHKPYLLVKEQVVPMATKLGIAEPELEALLRFYHQLGMLVYVNSTEALAKRVITNPQWLLDRVTGVIRDSRVQNNFLTPEGWPEEDVHDLAESGLASEALLLAAFGSRDFEYLSDFVVNTLLMCPAGRGSPDMLVPSMAPELTGRTLAQRLEEPVQCWLDFELLPDGVFQRLVCALVLYSNEYRNAAIPPRVWRSSATVALGKTEMVLESCGNQIMFSFAPGTQGISHAVALAVSLLKHIQATFLGGGLSWELLLISAADPSLCVPHSRVLDSPLDATTDSYVGINVDKDCEAEVPRQDLAVFFSDGLRSLVSGFPGRLTKGPDLFLSDDWGQLACGRDTHACVKRVATALRRCGYRVFMDEEHLLTGGASAAALERSVEQASLFLCFATEGYQAAVNGDAPCRERTAFRHAAATKERQMMLPVVLDPSLLDRAAWSGEFLAAFQDTRDEDVLDLTHVGEEEVMYGSIRKLLHRIARRLQ